KRLHGDPDRETLRPGNEAASPDLAKHPAPKGTSTIFSPRKSLNMLKWYAGSMDGKQYNPKVKLDLVCFTAAFGVNKEFIAILKRDEDHLRYIFLEKWGVKEELAKATQKALGADIDNEVAVGGRLEKSAIVEYLKGRWLAEKTNSLSSRVRFVHTKYL